MKKPIIGIIVALVLVIGAGGAYLFAGSSEDKPSKPKPKPEPKKPVPKPAPKKEAPKPIPKKPEPKKAPKPVLRKKGEQVFEVRVDGAVMGSFSSKSKAESLKRQLKAEGKKAKIVGVFC